MPGICRGSLPAAALREQLAKASCPKVAHIRQRKDARVAQERGHPEAQEVRRGEERVAVLAREPRFLAEEQGEYEGGHD